MFAPALFSGGAAPTLLYRGHRFNRRRLLSSEIRSSLIQPHHQDLSTQRCILTDITFRRGLHSPRLRGGAHCSLQGALRHRAVGRLSVVRRSRRAGGGASVAADSHRASSAEGAPSRDSSWRRAVTGTAGRWRRWEYDSWYRWDWIVRTDRSVSAAEDWGVCRGESEL